MKSINNKIKKPIISIGFDKTGKIVSNVDLNKINKLNDDNITDIIKVLNDTSNKLENKKNLTINNVQNLKFVKDFCLEYKINNMNSISIDDLIEVEVYIKNNMKLGAIKKFKEISGSGLFHAKRFIDEYSESKGFKFSYERNHIFQ